jgi:YaiO family outer membrane protein
MSKSVVTLAFLALLAAAAAAGAQTPTAAPALSVELAAESSHLNNGNPDWRATSLRVTRKRSQRELGEVSFQQTHRFGLDDHQIAGLYSTPLSDKLTASFDANISPTHRVLARHGAGASLQYEFAPAWLVHTGLAVTRYDTAHVKQANLMLEHYFSSFSVAAGWRPVQALGTSASSAELRGSYYYGDANFIGVIFSEGKEATSVNANTVLLADVRAVALTGRHWLTPKWAVSYALSSTRQGNFYNRNSVRIGAEYLF